MYNFIYNTTDERRNNIVSMFYKLKGMCQNCGQYHGRGKKCKKKSKHSCKHRHGDSHRQKVKTAKETKKSRLSTSPSKQNMSNKELSAAAISHEHPLMSSNSHSNSRSSSSSSMTSSEEEIVVSPKLDKAKSMSKKLSVIKSPSSAYRRKSTLALQPQRKMKFMSSGLISSGTNISIAA